MVRDESLVLLFIQDSTGHQKLFYVSQTMDSNVTYGHQDVSQAS